MQYKLQLQNYVRSHSQQQQESPKTTEHIWPLEVALLKHQWNLWNNMSNMSY
jgi:hypothetical protein